MFHSKRDMINWNTFHEVKALKTMSYVQQLKELKGWSKEQMTQKGHDSSQTKGLT